MEINTNQLKSIKKTLPAIHFPNARIDKLSIQTLKDTLAFEELLAQQAYITKLKATMARKESVIINKGQLRDKFIELLNFSLTESQLTVLKEIDLDLKSGTPMQRIIQGDVGSGKTVVAAAIAVTLIEKGYKVALMAPTEVLAEQHYSSINEFMNKDQYEIHLLTSSVKNRDKILENLKITKSNTLKNFLKFQKI